MLHRPDLGRIAPGCKADLLAWNLGSLFMVPLREGERLWPRMHVGDWAGRSVDERSPAAYPAFDTSLD